MQAFFSKHLIAGIIVGTMCLAAAFSSANKKKIEVDYNTKGITINYGIVTFPQNEMPFNVNETLYVPLTFLAKTLGYEVDNYLDNYINIGGGDVGRYLTQSDLLKDAMDFVGVDTPEKAVEIWSEGLKHRSAAIQYSVMTKELKEIYARDLEQGHANWVVGISSPWVEGYKIISQEKEGDKTHVYKAEYSTATSSGAYKPFIVILDVTKTSDFWRISNVIGDEISTAYTGFVYRNSID